MRKKLTITNNTGIDLDYINIINDLNEPLSDYDKALKTYETINGDLVKYIIVIRNNRKTINVKFVLPIDYYKTEV